jgi:hypothetical protein
MGLSIRYVWRLLRSGDCFPIWHFVCIRRSDVWDVQPKCCQNAHALLLTNVMDLAHHGGTPGLINLSAQCALIATSVPREVVSESGPKRLHCPSYRHHSHCIFLQLGKTQIVASFLILEVFSSNPVPQSTHPQIFHGITWSHFANAGIVYQTTLRSIPFKSFPIHNSLTVLSCKFSSWK